MRWARKFFCWIALALCAVGCTRTSTDGPRKYEGLRGRYASADGESTLEIFGESFRWCGRRCSKYYVKPITFDEHGDVATFTCVPKRKPMHDSWIVPIFKVVNSNPRRIEEVIDEDPLFGEGAPFGDLGEPRRFTETTTEKWERRHRRKR